MIVEQLRVIFFALAIATIVTLLSGLNLLSIAGEPSKPALFFFLLTGILGTLDLFLLRRLRETAQPTSPANQSSSLGSDQDAEYIRQGQDYGAGLLQEHRSKLDLPQRDWGEIQVRFSGRVYRVPVVQQPSLDHLRQSVLRQSGDDKTWESILDYSMSEIRRLNLCDEETEIDILQTVLKELPEHVGWYDWDCKLADITSGCFRQIIFGYKQGLEFGSIRTRIACYIAVRLSTAFDPEFKKRNDMPFCSFSREIRHWFTLWCLLNRPEQERLSRTDYSKSTSEHPSGMPQSSRPAPFALRRKDAELLAKELANSEQEHVRDAIEYLIDCDMI